LSHDELPGRYTQRGDSLIIQVAAGDTTFLYLGHWDASDIVIVDANGGTMVYRR